MDFTTTGIPSAGATEGLSKNNREDIIFKLRSGAARSQTGVWIPATPEHTENIEGARCAPHMVKKVNVL